MTGPAHFARDLPRFGDATALVLADGHVVSYAQLAREADAFSARLFASGIAAREIVLVLARNDLPSVAAYLGCLRARIPLMLLEPSVPRDRIDALVRALGVRAVVGEGGMIEATNQPARSVRHDLALLLSTSGSTGNPKSVMLSLENLHANAVSIASYLPMRPDDVAITSLPLPYSFGLSILNSHLLVGARVVLTGEPLVGKEFWRLVREYGVTSFAGVPFSYQMLRTLRFERMALPSLRYFTQAGGRLPAELVAYAQDLKTKTGLPFFVMYGQTEATARMAYLRPELLESHGDCIGEPIPGGEFFLRDPESGSTVEGPGAVGELVYRGPNVMIGYAESADDLASSGLLKELATGDLAERLPVGVYRITGRTKRIVKIQGKRWQLDHVEAELARRGIAALATGRDDKLRIAVIDPDTASTSRDDVYRWLNEELHVHPSLFEVVRLPEVPRTPNGKVDYPAILAYTPGDGP